MAAVTPAVCLQGSGRGPGEATGRRTRHLRKRPRFLGSGSRSPRRRPGAGEGSRERPARPCDSALPVAHPLYAQVGGRPEVATGQAGAETRLWGGQIGASASLPSLGLAGRAGGGAAGGHFSCGAAESRGCPPRPQTSTASRLVSSRPALLGAAPRPGWGEAARPGQPRAGAPGRRAGAGAGASCRRDPSAGASRGRGGRGREPLPILGRSRRRRRPAVGESKVVAGRHFGIFPQPAGHCGGHGESGPMAGEEAQRGRDTEGGKGRERGAVRSRSRPAGAAAAPPPPPASHSLTHSHARVAAAASSPEPAPTPAPPHRPGPGKELGRDLGGAHYTHHR